jgi:hypothetical protein
LLEVLGARVFNFEPSITLVLDETCRLQCRLSVETSRDEQQLRSGHDSDDPISIDFTVRQYWGAGPERSFLDSFRRQRELGEEIIQAHVMPKVLRPLAQAIASR